MIRLAKAKDIQYLIPLAKTLQITGKLYADVPVDDHAFAMWLSQCIFSNATEVLLYIEHDEILGFLILQETVYPWNFSFKYGSDLMFLCKKGGFQLVNAAKKIAKQREWKSLVFTTTCNVNRTDTFMSKVAKQIGGVYEL